MKSEINTPYSREIRFTPAYGKTDSDPNKNYGIHCVEMEFILTGKEGAIVLLIFTGWYLPQNRDLTGIPATRPRAASLTYHSRHRLHDGPYEPMPGCDYLGGDPCYSDSTYCVEEIFDLFVERGEEAVWEILEGRYRSTFVGA